MDNEISLEEIKHVEFELLVTLRDFCVANHIKFYLSNGTLLGAAKYGGFIPWDDDIDIMIPRQDYNRLVSEYVDTERIRLFAMEKDKNYYFPFAKLCDITTIKIESYTAFDNAVGLGLGIDIFPIDDFSNIKSLAIIKAFYSQIRVAFFSLAQMNSFQNHGFIKTLIYKVARRIGTKNIWKSFEQKYVYSPRKYVGNRIWTIYGIKEVMPKEVFSHEIMMAFEEEEFPVPEGYDIYLRSLYGDYEKDPPLEDQVTHHSFKAYKRADCRIEVRNIE